MVKEPFISLVIPESILGDNRLTYFDRILLIDIVSLCKKNEYCWPTNRYFMNNFNCKKPTVSKSISSLLKFGYIDIEINNSEIPIESKEATMEEKEEMERILESFREKEEDIK